MLRQLFVSIFLFLALILSAKAAPSLTSNLALIYQARLPGKGHPPLPCRPESDAACDLMAAYATILNEYFPFLPDQSREVQPDFFETYRMPGTACLTDKLWGCLYYTLESEWLYWSQALKQCSRDARAEGEKELRRQAIEYFLSWWKSAYPDNERFQMAWTATKKTPSAQGHREGYSYSSNRGTFAFRTVSECEIDALRDERGRELRKQAQQKKKQEKVKEEKDCLQCEKLASPADGLSSHDFQALMQFYEEDKSAKEETTPIKENKEDLLQKGAELALAKSTTNPSDRAVIERLMADPAYKARTKAYYDGLVARGKMSKDQVAPAFAKALKALFPKKTTKASSTPLPAPTPLAPAMTSSILNEEQLAAISATRPEALGQLQEKARTWAKGFRQGPPNFQVGRFHMDTEKNDAGVFSLAQYHEGLKAYEELLALARPIAADEGVPLEERWKTIMKLANERVTRDYAKDQALMLGGLIGHGCNCECQTKLLSSLSTDLKLATPMDKIVGVEIFRAAVGNNHLQYVSYDKEGDQGTNLVNNQAIRHRAPVAHAAYMANKWLKRNGGSDFKIKDFLLKGITQEQSQLAKEEAKGQLSTPDSKTNTNAPDDELTGVAFSFGPIQSRSIMDFKDTNQQMMTPISQNRAASNGPSENSSTSKRVVSNGSNKKTSAHDMALRDFSLYELTGELSNFPFLKIRQNLFRSDVPIEDKMSAIQNLAAYAEKIDDKIVLINALSGQASNSLSQMNDIYLQPGFRAFVKLRAEYLDHLADMPIKKRMKELEVLGPEMGANYLASIEGRAGASMVARERRVGATAGKINDAVYDELVARPLLIGEANRSLNFKLKAKSTLESGSSGLNSGAFGLDPGPHEGEVGVRPSQQKITGREITVDAYIYFAFRALEDICDFSIQGTPASRTNRKSIYTFNAATGKCTKTDNLIGVLPPQLTIEWGGTLLPQPTAEPPMSIVPFGLATGVEIERKKRILFAWNETTSAKIISYIHLTTSGQGGNTQALTRLMLYVFDARAYFATDEERKGQMVPGPFGGMVPAHMALVAKAYFENTNFATFSVGISFIKEKVVKAHGSIENYLAKLKDL